MFLTRARQVVGLDIGSHSIKMVALRAAKGDLPFELTHFGLADLPEDVIVDGSIVEPDVVARAITQLFDQHKVRSALVATSISGNAVIVRRVNMPRGDADELRESFRWEAEQYIPFDINEVDLDFAILDEDAPNDTMDVVLVAAKRDRVDEYVDVVDLAKRSAAIMDVDAFAIQNAFEFSYPERQFEDIAILNLGSSLINMAVLEGGQPAFWRDIAIGMRQFVVALQREFMLDPFDAEEVLRRAGRQGYKADDGLVDWSADGEEGAKLRDAASDPRVGEVIGEVSDQIVAEIRKTFDFYQSQALRDHFDAVFLAGGGAYVGELASRLESHLGWPVERFDSMRRVLVPERGFDRDYVAANSPQVALALGLALRGVMK